MSEAVKEKVEAYVVPMPSMVKVFGDPFDCNPWGYGTDMEKVRIYRELEYLDHRHESELREYYAQDKFKNMVLNWDQLLADYHASRVAYLTVRRDHTPIALEVVFGGTGLQGSYIIDGWHRYTAAFYMGWPTINATFAGGSSKFFELFYPRCSEENVRKVWMVPASTPRG